MTSERLARAYCFSANKHRNQRRKDVDHTPYINHPIEVAYLLTKVGVTDEDTIIAAVLHDTIEDTGTKAEEISKEFGDNVTSIVLECTDDKSLDKVRRKELQIEHTETISSQAKLVKLADKYSNLSALATSKPVSWSDKRAFGYALWSWAVVSRLRNLNSEFDKMFDELLKVHNFTSLSSSEINAGLNSYYQLLKSDGDHD